MTTSYRFLDFQLDLAERRMTHNGDAVSLRPKTFATLQYLVEHRDRVVTKEELLSEIWPGVVVQDQAVFQSISELRGLLGPGNCIETTRGRGYQWIVETVAVQPRSSNWRLPLGVATSLLMLLIAALLWNQPSTTTAIVIHPTANGHDEMPPDRAASGLDFMLVQHLRRMGWQAYLEGTKPDHPETVNLMTRAARSSNGIRYEFILRGNGIHYSGRVASPTTLGAIRDLASEIHLTLAPAANSERNGPSVNYLFTEARQHLENDEPELADPYLRSILAKQPDHRGAKITLAMVSQHDGRMQDAYDLAFSAYRQATDVNARPDRMVSALLLSQVLLAEDAIDASEKFATEAMTLASQINDLLVVAEAQEQLGELSLATGQVDAGREQLVLARQLFSSFCPSGESRVARRLLELETVPTVNTADRSLL